MDPFDFKAPAEVFASNGRGAARRPMTYRRFANGAEAVQYAMEALPPEMLFGAVLEAGGSRFSVEDIRGLYESPQYPLERRKSPKAPV